MQSSRVAEILFSSPLDTRKDSPRGWITAPKLDDQMVIAIKALTANPASSLNRDCQRSTFSSQIHKHKTHSTADFETISQAPLEGAVALAAAVTLAVAVTLEITV
jgi:hypothetical protein